MLIVVLVERDELAAAAALVEAHVAEQLATESSELYSDHYLLNSRGRLRLASGDVQGGIYRFSAVGRRQDAAGESNPAVIDWRSQAAVGLLHLGDRPVPETSLRRSWRGPSALVLRADRCRRACDWPRRGGDRGLEWLQRVASTLEFSSARLEHAWALVDLGAALDGPDAGTEPADPCVTAAHSPNSAVRPPSRTAR